MNNSNHRDDRSLERQIASWMADEASGTRSGEAIDDILTATSHVRPEPRWLALLKEPPMRLNTQVVAGSPARRMIIALAVVGLLAGLIGAAVVAGAGLFRDQTPRPLAELAWHTSAPGLGGIPPANLAFDGQGNIWLADSSNGRFAIFKRDGTFLEYWGSAGTGQAQFNLRRANGDGYGAVAFAPNGSFYVLDVGNLRVQAFDAQRRFVRSWGGTGDGPGQYRGPTSILVGPDGTVYVLEEVREVVESYDPDGNVLGSVVVPPAAGGGEFTTNGLAIDKDGNYYITRADPNAVVELSNDGTVIRTIGTTGPGRFVDQPSHIAFDSLGRLYITQGTGKGRAGMGVAVFDPNGQYITGFGPLRSGYGTAVATESLTFPTGILLDGRGNLYVEDVTATGPELKMFRLGPPLVP
jgi:hypothetical protein